MRKSPRRINETGGTYKSAVIYHHGWRFPSYNQIVYYTEADRKSGTSGKKADGAVLAINFKSDKQMNG